MGYALHPGLLDGSLRLDITGAASPLLHRYLQSHTRRAEPGSGVGSLWLPRSGSSFFFSLRKRARADPSPPSAQGFSSISVDAAEYYNCSQITINTLVTVGNFAQIFVALIWTMNLESTYGLQIPYVVGVALLFVGGWLSYIGAPSERHAPSRVSCARSSYARGCWARAKGRQFAPGSALLNAVPALAVRPARPSYRTHRKRAVTSGSDVCFPGGFAIFMWGNFPLHASGAAFGALRSLSATACPSVEQLRAHLAPVVLPLRPGTLFLQFPSLPLTLLLHCPRLAGSRTRRGPSPLQSGRCLRSSATRARTSCRR